MKNTAQKPLGFLLEGLLYGEIKLSKVLPLLANEVSTPSLKKEMVRYADSSHSKLKKTDRVFNYLMHEPKIKKSQVIDTLLAESKILIKLTTSRPVQDLLLLSCVQAINHYKSVSYGTALAFAEELKLDTACELLYEIVEWEKQAEKELQKIAEEISLKALEFSK